MINVDFYKGEYFCKSFDCFSTSFNIPRSWTTTNVISDITVNLAAKMHEKVPKHTAYCNTLQSVKEQRIGNDQESTGS